VTFVMPIAYPKLTVTHTAERLRNSNRRLEKNAHT